MPAPNFQAQGAAVGSVGAATVSWPAHQTNDIGVLFVESANEAVTLTTASGFVEGPNSPQGIGTAADVAATRLTWFWCRATSGTMADVVVADAGDHVVCRIETLRGCIQSGNPYNVTAGDTGASSTAITNPAVTTTVPNTLILLAASTCTDTATGQFSNWANSNLTGVTLQCNLGSISGNGGGFGITTGTFAGTGDIGTSTSTLAGASAQGRLTLAFQPPPDLTLTLNEATGCIVADPVTFSWTASLVVNAGTPAAVGNNVTFVMPSGGTAALKSNRSVGG
jgi:hypothetical protein